MLLKVALTIGERLGTQASKYWDHGEQLCNTREAVDGHMRSLGSLRRLGFYVARMREDGGETDAVEM